MKQGYTRYTTDEAAKWGKNMESVIKWSAIFSIPRFGVMRWSGYIEDEHSTLIRVAFNCMRWLRFWSAKKNASCRPGTNETKVPA